jgi:hypothetical protein
MAVDSATAATTPAAAPAAPPTAPAPLAKPPISRGHESNNVNNLNGVAKQTPEDIARDTADEITKNILKKYSDLGDRMIAFGKAYKSASDEVKRFLWYSYGLHDIVEDEVRYCFEGLGQSINDKDYGDFVKTLVTDVTKRNLPREIKLAFLHKAHSWAHYGGGSTKADSASLKTEIDKLISSVEKEGPDPSWLSDTDKGEKGYTPPWLKSYIDFEGWD